MTTDMPRTVTTVDAFNAVTEPRLRQILDALAESERPVNDLVAPLDIAHPQVSKHLRVLREVGLVEDAEQGEAERSSPSRRAIYAGRPDEVGWATRSGCASLFEASEGPAWLPT